ncbi:MAG TPA: GNAT family N-acetyltransferase [Tepidisphaeraceae bacterium]|nr:GNAT family N-acetyltransferase [Tepidisphaeraceae bacterium]
MTIRPATPDDVPSVLPMVGKLAALHEAWDPQRYDYRQNVESMYDRWLRARATDGRSVFLVAERDQRLIGFIIGTIEHTIPIYRLEETGYLHDLWVDEQYRHEGAGRQMAMLAVEKFRELGVKQIRLETAMANEAARKLFESCGFRACAIEMLVELPQVNP